MAVPCIGLEGEAISIDAVDTNYVQEWQGPGGSGSVISTYSYANFIVQNDYASLLPLFAAIWGPPIEMILIDGRAIAFSLASVCAILEIDGGGITVFAYDSILNASSSYDAVLADLVLGGQVMVEKIDVTGARVAIANLYADRIEEVTPGEPVCFVFVSSASNQPITIAEPIATLAADLQS